METHTIISKVYKNSLLTETDFFCSLLGVICPFVSYFQMFPFLCSDCGKSIANYDQLKKHRKKCPPAALDSSSQQETELTEQVLLTAHLVARHRRLLLGVVVVVVSN